jgi:uncharacterized protein (TIGR03067 family)
MLSRNLLTAFLTLSLLAVLSGCDTRPKIVMPTGPVPPPPRPAVAGGAPAQPVAPDEEPKKNEADLDKPAADKQPAVKLPSAGDKEDKQMLQGAWVVESGEGGGKALTDEDKKKWNFVFDGDKLTYAGFTFPGFTVYPEKSPKWIDIWTLDLPQEGIYKFDDRRLHLCLGGPKKRPTEFKTDATNNFIYLILKREK